MEGFSMIWPYTGLGRYERHEGFRRQLQPARAYIVLEYHR